MVSNKYSNEYFNQCIADYLECAKIYKGASSKKKTNLVELIVYGHITNKVNKINLVDITKTERNQIFKKK